VARALRLKTAPTKKENKNCSVGHDASLCTKKTSDASHQRAARYRPAELEAEAQRSWRLRLAN